MTSTETKPTAQSGGSAPSSLQSSASANKVFWPRADIFESKDTVEIVADMPGVDENALDITLEKSVLTIRGKVEPSVPEGFKSAYSEFEEGDYERSFKLSDDIDRDGIKASIKNGVLRVTLVKSGPAQPRKIEIKAS